jgi:hypothetical protein|tara:strand:+ start:45 stop:734 length:690 start_codon:yes stop_codon:yes gene_type:complete
MFDTTVQIFQSNQLADINFLEYIKNKKIIICPKVKISQRPTLVYLEYLDSLIDTHDVDEIIIINSTQDNFFHMLVESYFPRITTMTDKSQNYIKSLKESKDKTGSVKDLTENWIFQQVLDNCQEIGFWEQPSSDNWKHLLANKTAIKALMKFGSWQRKIIQKLYKLRHTTDMWNTKDQNIMRYSEEKGSMEGWSLSAQMGANFWYFNLFHNKELETTLRQINNRSGKTS